jgi:hypothetical protein
VSGGLIVGTYVVELILSGLALLGALFALVVAGQTWRHAPGARLWAELRLRIEDLEADNDALHDRIHTAARRSNVAKATEVRVRSKQERDSLLDEAAAALANPAPAAAAPAGDEQAQLAHWRRRAGLH